jgi:hypothetical protein
MKRNHDKYTNERVARLNILQGLREYHFKTAGRGTMNKAGLGYMAFPNYDFNRPQGAAFSVAKIVRKLEDEGLVTYRVGITRGYYISQIGLDYLASLC